MKKIRLGVNIDHVATVRNARGENYPSPLRAALIAQKSGADSVTIHLREDRRHIQDDDVKAIRNKIKTRMNLESAVTNEMIDFALKIKPEDVCLVPERREELTTEGGLDVVEHFDQVKRACSKLAEAGIRVSLFIDTDLVQIDAAVRAGAPAIEIHTGHYADALIAGEQQERLEQIRSAVAYGIGQGLQVNAGHGLHYSNVQSIAEIPNISELNIGHSIIARALFVGAEQAVREMKKLILENQE